MIFEDEWKSVTKCVNDSVTIDGESSSQPVTDSQSLLSENLQVFVMSNVLRRPVVVLGPDSSTCPGVYLPLLWDPADCIRYPIVLEFQDGRFAPLVGCTEQTGSGCAGLNLVPLVTSRFEPLQVWFLLPSEEARACELEQSYLNMMEVNLTNSDGVNMVLGARLKYELFSLGNDASGRQPPTRDICVPTSALIPSSDLQLTEQFNGKL